MKFTEKQKADREALRLKMCHHQDEASKYRKQIELIDNKARDKDMKSILGKCFLQRSDKGAIHNHGYVRVEGFRRDYTPVGTIVHIYGKGKNPMTSVEFNHHIFRDWINNGHQISHARFNKYLRQAKAMIKLKK